MNIRIKEYGSLDYEEVNSKDEFYNFLLRIFNNELLKYDDRRNSLYGEINIHSCALDFKGLIKLLKQEYEKEEIVFAIKWLKLLNRIKKTNDLNALAKKLDLFDEILSDANVHMELSRGLEYSPTEIEYRKEYEKKEKEKRILINSKVIEYLKEGFNIEYNDDITNLDKFIDGLDKDKKDLYYNYLLKKDDEFAKIFVWNNIIDEDDGNYTGLVHDLYVEAKKYKKKYYSQGWTHISYNYTEVFSNDCITLIPDGTNDLYESIIATASHDKEDGGICYYFGMAEMMQDKNGYYFEIKNKNNISVGVIIMEQEDKNVFNYIYYILPKYRRLGYGYQAAKLLTQMITDKKIIGQELDDYYKYILNIKPVIVDAINIRTKNKMKSSYRIAEKLGFDLAEKYNGKDLKKKNYKWRRYQLIISK